MIKIGKVIGDVIEAGGVKNVTNNYYEKSPATEEGEDRVMADDELPEQLKGEQAEALMERLVDAELLDDGWQPVGLSGAEKALVARAVGERLGIHEVWQVFGRLWNVKPESLRAFFNRALEQRKSLGFQDRLKKLFD